MCYRPNMTTLKTLGSLSGRIMYYSWEYQILRISSPRKIHEIKPDVNLNHFTGMFYRPNIPTCGHYEASLGELHITFYRNQILWISSPRKIYEIKPLAKLSLFPVCFIDPLWQHVECYNVSRGGLCITFCNMTECVMNNARWAYNTETCLCESEN